MGTEAPPFVLPDTVSGKDVSLREVANDKKATVVMFLCNHCPYVKHVNSELARLAKDYANEGVAFVGISSNDVENYPDDRPELMTKVAEEEGYTFPYLYDESQNVARAYDAACTPDFYVFDADLKLVYRGRLDDSRPGNDIALSGKDLRKAINGALAGDKPLAVQYPSAGCNIKWK